MQGRRWRAVGAVLAAASCWGTQGILTLLILDRIETDELTVATLRAVTASCLLWGWLVLTDQGALRIKPRDVPAFALFGVITVTVFYLALVYAYDRTSVAVATILLYLATALVTLTAVRFLGEPLTRVKLVALALTFGGCLLVVRAYRPANLSASLDGIAFGLVAASSFASYSLLGKRLLARHRPATVLAYPLVLGAFVLIAIKIVVSPAAWSSPQETLTIGLATGITMTLAPVTLYTLGLRGLPSSEASILATFELVVALILAATVLGERLALPQRLGALCVTAGVVLLSRPVRTPRAGRTTVDRAAATPPASRADA